VHRGQPEFFIELLPVGAIETGLCLHQLSYFRRWRARAEEFLQHRAKISLLVRESEAHRKASPKFLIVRRT